MTTAEYMFIAMIGLVIVAFMMGSLWEQAGQEIENEGELNERN